MTRFSFPARFFAILSVVLSIGFSLSILFSSDALAQGGFPVAPGSSTGGGSCSGGTTEGFGPFTFTGPLVPCGRSCNQPCTICHLIILISNIFKLLMSLIMLVTILLITVAGVLYIVSAGQPKMKSMAKGVLTKTLTGFGVFFLSWLIVVTVLRFIAANSSVLGTNGLFNFTCDTSSLTPGQRPGGSGGGGTGSGGTPQPGQAGNCAGYATESRANSQCNLVSNDLNGLLTCMQSHGASGQLGSITSSSVGGNWNASYNCCGNPACAHVTMSCHYGCGMGNNVEGNGQGYSHAVDIGTSGMSDAQLCATAQAAQQCGAGQILGPTDRTNCGGAFRGDAGHTGGTFPHLHIPTSSCYNTRR